MAMHVARPAGVVGQRLQVGDEQRLPVPVLQRHAAPERPDVVAEVEHARRPVAGEDRLGAGRVALAAVRGGDGRRDRIGVLSECHGVVSPFVRLMARASVRRDDRPDRSHPSICASRMDDGWDRCGGPLEPERPAVHAHDDTGVA
jgi:hypothetical protein